MVDFEHANMLSFSYEELQQSGTDSNQRKLVSTANKTLFYIPDALHIYANSSTKAKL